MNVSLEFQRERGSEGGKKVHCSTGTACSTEKEGGRLGKIKAAVRSRIDEVERNRSHESLREDRQTLTSDDAQSTQLERSQGW